MRDYEAKFKEKGANLVAIGLGGADYARLFRDETKIDFPLLIDEENQTHKAAGLRKANLLHLLRSDNAAARKRAKSAGHNLFGFFKDLHRLIANGGGCVHIQKKLVKDPFQLGGSFVFGPGNVDRFAHISQTFGDNARMESLLAAVPAR